MNWTVQVFSPSLALEDEFEVEHDVALVALDAAIKRLWKGTASFALPAVIRLWPTGAGERGALCYAATYPADAPDVAAEPTPVHVAELGDVLGEWRAGIVMPRPPGGGEAPA